MNQDDLQPYLDMQNHPSFQMSSPLERFVENVSAGLEQSQKIRPSMNAVVA